MLRPPTDVIGNNIANSATYGFKSGSASFADMFAGSKVGLGVKVAGITDFTDGTTTNTGRGRTLPSARTVSSVWSMLTARCSTAVTASSSWTKTVTVNMQGMQLTGYPVAGTPSTVQTGANPQPINIPTTLMAAKATTTASQQINLNSTDTAPTTAFDPANPDTYNKKVRSPSLTAG